MDCIFRGLPLRYSDSANAHMLAERIFPQTLCDMINHSIDCPQNAPKPHRRTAIRVCSNRRGKVYAIMIEKDYTIDIHQDAYLVTHFKPV